MKIIIESQDDKVEISNNVKNIKDALKLVRRALIGIGYHPNNIKEGFAEEANNE